jgi:hypothetical protein
LFQLALQDLIYCQCLERGSLGHIGWQQGVV